METDIVPLFDLTPYEQVSSVQFHLGKQVNRDKPERCTDCVQGRIFSVDNPELKMQKAADKAYVAWLKKSLREYPHLQERIDQLERLAAGVTNVVSRKEHRARNPSKYLSDKERYLVEVIKTAMPSAFAGKSTGLMTHGRFSQQVRTIVQREPKLEPLIDSLLDAKHERELIESPVEKVVIREEESRDHAIRLAKQLRQEKTIFDVALAQMQKYWPALHELLSLRFFLRYSAIKVQMEMEFDSESTYASHLRDALRWIGRYERDARGQMH